MLAFVFFAVSLYQIENVQFISDFLRAFILRALNFIKGFFVSFEIIIQDFFLFNSMIVANYIIFKY